MAKPKPTNYVDKFEHYYDFDEIEIPKQYQTIKSRGIKKLAAPKKKRNKFNKGLTAIQKKNLISKYALKYKASDRMRELAKPKNYLIETPSNPYSVKEAALRKLPKSKAEIFNKLATTYEWKKSQKFEKNNKY